MPLFMIPMVATMLCLQACTKSNRVANWYYTQGDSEVYNGIRVEARKNKVRENPLDD